MFDLNVSQEAFAIFMPSISVHQEDRQLPSSHAKSRSTLSHHLFLNNPYIEGTVVVMPVSFVFSAV